METAKLQKVEHQVQMHLEDTMYPPMEMRRTRWRWILQRDKKSVCRMPNSRQEELGSSEDVPLRKLFIDTGSVDNITGNVIANRRDGAATACGEQASFIGMTGDGILRNLSIPTRTESYPPPPYGVTSESIWKARHGKVWKCSIGNATH